MCYIKTFGPGTSLGGKMARRNFWRLAYDAVSRRTLAKGLTPGGDYLAAMAYGYDAAGRLTSVNGWGLAPWGVSPYGGSASYQYNANGSLARKALGVGPDAEKRGGKMGRGVLFHPPPTYWMRETGNY